jgi:hypothetical protein
LSVRWLIFLEKDKDVSCWCDGFDQFRVVALAPSVSADLIAHVSGELA